MSSDGRRVHLIERAALRLDDVPARTGAAPAPILADARPEIGEAPPGVAPVDIPRDGGSAVIDEAALRRAGMVDWSGPNTRVAEEFRIAQTELVRRSGGENQGGTLPRSRLVMVTSAFPGEGKSFNAINLAVGIARQDGRRVLLIDADGKPGSLGDLLGLSGAPGLIDLAANRSLDPSGLLVATCIATLDFLPIGGDASNSPAAFAGDGAAGAIADLARRYADRLIIMDVPPCLSSSRAHLLAPLVGQVVLVVAAGSTQQGDVEAALGLVRSCPGTSLLLNKVSRWQTHSFGSNVYAT